MTDPVPLVSSTGSYVRTTPESLTPPFELEQLGIRVELVPTLVDPVGLGVWIFEQTAEVQALILTGWLVEPEPAPADVMLATRAIAQHLRTQRIDPAWITPALEHLLTALRTRKDTDDAQPE